MKFTLILYVGLASWATLVKGGISKLEPYVPEKAELALELESTVEQERFTWVLGLNSWKVKDADSIAPQETITTCGSRIALSTALTYFHYEPNGGYVPNQRCLWILESNSTGLDLYFNSLSSTTGNNGITLFYFPTIGTTNLTLVKIPNTDQAEYHYPMREGVAYIMFSSNENGRGLGLSFAVKAAGPEDARKHSHTSLTFIDPTGSVNARYVNNAVDTYAFVPPPNRLTNVLITFLDLENGYDFLRVFTLIPYHASGSLIPAFSYTGLYPFGPPSSETSSEEARIYLIVTDNSILRDGVSLRWTSE